MYVSNHICLCKHKTLSKYYFTYLDKRFIARLCFSNVNHCSIFDMLGVLTPAQPSFLIWAWDQPWWVMGLYLSCSIQISYHMTSHMIECFLLQWERDGGVGEPAPCRPHAGEPCCQCLGWSTRTPSTASPPQSSLWTHHRWWRPA